jgi:hypothetical protein
MRAFRALRGLRPGGRDARRAPRAGAPLRGYVSSARAGLLEDFD